MPEASQSLTHALRSVADLGLLTPAETADGGRKWVVHRWTARALARLTANETLREAHQRAARYWASRRKDSAEEASLEHLLEERHHRYRAGHLGRAFLITDVIKELLFNWGEYRRLEQLYLEMLEWYRPGSYEAGYLESLLGNLSERAGEYEAAMAWHGRALQTFEALGEQGGIARVYQSFGQMAQLRGDHDQGTSWYEKALELFEANDEPVNVALCYYNLAAGCEGSPEEALALYKNALAIFEQQGARWGIANTVCQLAHVTRETGDTTEAFALGRTALEHFVAMQDEVGIAAAYELLGKVAHQRGLLTEAAGYYRNALEITEKAGDRAASAMLYKALGALAHQQGALQNALSWYERCLETEQLLGNRTNLASTCHLLGLLNQDLGLAEVARAWFEREAEHRGSGAPGGDISPRGG